MAWGRKTPSRFLPQRQRRRRKGFASLFAFCAVAVKKAVPGTKRRPAMRKTKKKLDAKKEDMERELCEMKARCEVFDDALAWEIRKFRACLQRAGSKPPDFYRKGEEGE
jgi:hypothetical protein